METLSFHSDESAGAMGIKTLIMNISVNFLLYPPYGFLGEEFWICSSANLMFWLPWQPINTDSLDKIHMEHRELLKEHYCKAFVKTS